MPSCHNFPCNFFDRVNRSFAVCRVVVLYLASKCTKKIEIKKIVKPAPQVLLCTMFFFLPRVEIKVQILVFFSLEHDLNSISTHLSTWPTHPSVNRQRQAKDNFVSCHFPRFLFSLIWTCLSIDHRRTKIHPVETHIDFNRTGFFNVSIVRSSGQLLLL